MALVLKDRVRESSSSSGTGSITLSGAFTGYQTFDSVVANGSTVYYTIHNTTSPNDGEWEVGVGTFTSPSTLSRDTVLSSSAGGTTKVSFSGSSVLEVFITQPAGEAVYLNQATGLVEIGGNGTNTVSFTNINTTNLTANTVTLTAGTISTTPNAATDIANKQYVDEVAEGLLTKPAVEVATTGNLTSTYYNGVNDDGVGATLTATTNGAFPEIDGVTLTSTTFGENGVLVKNQTAGLQNGRYNLTTVGDGSNPWVLTRCALCDESSEIPGAFTFVKRGTLYAGTGWVQVVTDPATFQIGVDPIFVFQFSGAGTYTAGTGLTLTDTTFSITNTAVTPATYGNAGAVAQFTVNAQGQLTNAANVSINASSISVGTLANDRTTAASANGASTIVLRDSNGNFTANTITATTSNATTFNGTTGAFTSVSGNGVALTAINASNVTSGTLDNARTTGNTANSASTLVLRDADGNFGANTITATFSGNGATLSAINASNISSGTIANARTTAASANGASTIVQRDSGGNFAAATVTAAIIGDLSGGSNINASNVSSGTIANARTTASAANGASTIVLRGASGEFAAGAITGTSFSGNGSAITAINASAITTGTIDNARTTAATANGASTIVLRGASGEFSAGAITGVSFTGSGAALSAINASNISSGTVATARLGSGTANASTFLRGDQTYAVVSSGTLIPSGTVMLFAQTAAPTGFTKNTTTGNNHALRVVTGTASTGGSVAFTTAFASQAVSGTVTTTTGNTTATNNATTATNQVATATNQSYTPTGSVSITAVSGSAGATTLSTPQIPSHTHTAQQWFFDSSAPRDGFRASFKSSQQADSVTNATGGGGSHTHPFSFSSGSGTFSGSAATITQNSHNHTQDSHNHTQNAHNHTASSSFTGTAINLAVQYIDVIRATKD